MAYRDIKNSVDTAKREGIAEGMEKGMKEPNCWVLFVIIRKLYSRYIL